MERGRRSGESTGRPRSNRAAGFWSVAALLCLGCAATRPEQPEDLCAIFSERTDWYEAARDSHRRWGVPVPLQLAVIRQESGFNAYARPPRTNFLWIFPGPRPSSAYGYGQVLDGTWEAYRDRTGRSSADRDEFEDVVDFIGWYGRVGEERYGIPKTDPYAFYLSYHQGHAGYARGTHPPSARTRSVARRVEAQTQRYGRQYALCRERLDDAVDGPWWWPF